MPEETKDLRYDPTKSLQERKESAIAGRLEILQALLWGFSNLSSGIEPRILCNL